MEYREPKMRSLKNRLLSSTSKQSRPSSQRRMYTKVVGGGGGGGPLSGSLNGKRATSAKLLVKRLTHYASMADAAAESGIISKLTYVTYVKLPGRVPLVQPINRY